VKKRTKDGGEYTVDNSKFANRDHPLLPPTADGALGPGDFNHKSLTKEGAIKRQLYRRWLAKLLLK